MDKQRDILSLRGKLPERRIEAPSLLIDVCGAVFDDSHWRRWLYQLLMKMGMHTNYVAFYRLWEQEYLPHVKVGRADFADTLQRFLLSAGLTTAQSAEVWVAVRARKRAFECDLSPMPGVTGTLRSLQAGGFRLAAMTSTQAVEKQLEQLQVGSCFERTYRSAELAGLEGGEQHYRSALAGWCGGPPESVALVSQDPWELQRAAAAGLMTIAVNFDGAIEADAHLVHLGEIHNVLTLPTSRRMAG